MEDPPKDYHRLAPGREVRLRHGYVIKCERVVKDESGDVVELVCSHDPASLGEATPGGRRIKGTIHWVSAAHAFEAEVRLYDRLFLAEAPGTNDDMHKELNPDSLVVVRGKMEPSLASAKPGDRVQLERLGFFFVDPVDSKDGAPIFNRTVGLKDSWAKVVKAAAAPTAAPAEPKAQKKDAPKKDAPKKERAELSPEARSLAATHGISDDEATLLAEDAPLRALFEASIAAGADAKVAAKWTANEVRALAKEAGDKPLSLTGSALAELLAELKAGVLSGTSAKDVLAETARTGDTPRAIIEKRGMRQITDAAALDSVAASILAENADIVARYRAGNANLFGALVGAAMKKTAGKANAKALQDALKKALG